MLDLGLQGNGVSGEPCRQFVVGEGAVGEVGKVKNNFQAVRPQKGVIKV